MLLRSVDDTWYLTVDFEETEIMAKKISGIPIFHYDPTDFNYTIKNDETESKLDTILKEKWKFAEEHQILRYNLKITDWKILQGPYKFLAQLNVDRAFNRRAPEHISSMSQSFDASRFNFTKLPSKEIFLDIGDATGNDVIAANVSPIEWGHCLLLTDRLKCLPQRITESSLLKSFELMLLSNSQYFRMVFNSLCAHASVNHLHWHLYYLKHEMLLENIELQELKAPVFIFKDYPAKGFCLKLSSFFDRNIKSFAETSFSLINYLQENNVAHNVYITRARRDSHAKIYDDVRIYIWARKPSTGVKDTLAFIPAVCELFGHLSVRSEEEYKNLSEGKVVEILADVTTDVFNQVKDTIKDKIGNEIVVRI